MNHARKLTVTAMVLAGLIGCGHTDTENAIHERNQHGLERMLSADPSTVDAHGTHGYTPLIYAAKDGNYDAAETLVNRRADVNAVDADGRTALMYAAGHNYGSIAKLLIAHGARANARDADGHTALSFARDRGYEEMAALLQTPAVR